jgi:hypothetical protein
MAIRRDYPIARLAKGIQGHERIKGVKHQRIYRIDTNRDYEQLSCLVARSDRTIDPNEIAEHGTGWDDFTPHWNRPLTELRAGAQSGGGNCLHARLSAAFTERRCLRQVAGRG